MLNIPKSGFIHYLKLLGVPQREPSLDALKEIIKAQMLNVPFENISKLYYLKQTGLKGIPDFEQFLAGVEKFHFGGTCYSNNYYLNLLLKYLGYETKLCGADMSKPDVHIANIVTIEGREYIADTGYAAPFLEPLPRGLKQDYIISSGVNKYVLKPQDSSNCSRMELHKQGILQHGYLLKSKSRSIDEFANVIEDSYRTDATFMNAVLLTKFSQEHSYIIHNMNYVEIKTSSAYMKPVDTKEELINVINKTFGIPAGILKTVLDDLEMKQDAWN